MDIVVTNVKGREEIFLSEHLSTVRHFDFSRLLRK
jgi:hypothetical protein